MILLRPLRLWLAGIAEAYLRTQARLVAAVRSEWSLLLPATLMVTSLTYTFEKAEWVADSQPVVSALFLGWLFGLLLAYSRRSALFAALYTAGIALFFTANRLGQTTPPPGAWFTNPFWQSVETLHLRWVTFALRASGWLATLRQGDSVRDTGLFVWLLSLLGWLALTWLAWWLVRRRVALPGLLPLTFLMAVNIHLSHQVRPPLAIFLGLALLLVARTAYTHRRSDWDRRRVDYPEDIGLDWGGWAVLAAVLIALFALLTPYIGTKEGWQVVSDWVRRSRVQMAESAEQLFGGVNTPMPDPDADDLIPSVALPDMGNIGRRPPSGKETVFWVAVNDPAPVTREMLQGLPVEKLPDVPRHYWRGGIYSTYTGRGWEADPAGTLLENVPLPEEVPAEYDSPGRYRLVQDFEIVAIHSGALFSVNQPVAVSRNYRLRRIASDESALLQGQGQSYRVVSLATRVTVAQLNDAPTVLPEGIRAAYLQLPAELPGRVERLAREITAGASTPYQKALRLQEYLRLNYSYELDTVPAPEGKDVVDDFLFESGQGYCSHFASAMTVMLRTVGVPARVVNGYAMGEYDLDRGMYRVTLSYAHAWVEVYFPGYGWVEFEPTSAYGTFQYASGGSGPPDALTNPLPTPPNSLTSGGRAGWWLLLVLLPLILWGWFFWSRAQKRRGPDTLRQAIQLYTRIRRQLAWCGLTFAPSMTPDECLQQCREQLIPYPQIENALAQATQVYTRAEYSPRPPVQADVRRAEAAWQQSSQEWLRLFLSRESSQGKS